MEKEIIINQQFFKQELSLDQINGSDPRETLNQIGNTSIKKFKKQACSSVICLYSKKGTRINSYCIMIPLISKKGSTNKGVLIQKFWSDSPLLSKSIVSECVKHAWEIGYHAAFTENRNEAFLQVGFESVSEFSINGKNGNSFLGMELSWDGFKNISRNLHIHQNIVSCLQNN